MKKPIIAVLLFLLITIPTFTFMFADFRSFLLRTNEVEYYLKQKEVNPNNGKILFDLGVFHWRKGKEARVKFYRNIELYQVDSIKQIENKMHEKFKLLD